MAKAPAPDQAWRQQRLDALAEHEDFRSRAALGRALGYKDGAYIRQMIEGDRPITEKTIVLVEAMRGGKFKGWFDKTARDDGIRFSVIDAPAPLEAREPSPSSDAAAPPPPPPDFADRRKATDSDWTLLDALQWLPQEERDAVIKDVTTRAEKMRAYVLERLDKVNGKAKGKIDHEDK